MASDKQTKSNEKKSIEHNPQKTNNNNNKSNWNGFKPGQSGNPKGRPPLGDAWADVYNEILDSKEIDITINLADGTQKVIKLDATKKMRYALGVAMLNSALKGNVHAAKELADRTVGRAPQHITGMERETLPQSITIGGYEIVF